jgi:hypothetical protein
MPKVFHSIHKGWGVISGPGNQPESQRVRQPEPPGEFVSEALRADCMRFLDELRTQLHRRVVSEHPAGWVPAERTPGRGNAPRPG